VSDTRNIEIQARRNEGNEERSEKIFVFFVSSWLISRGENLRAAILHSFTEPLIIQEIPTPTPGSGEVLIKVVACGVCHSDLHLALGEWDLLRQITKLPLVLGHEVTGSVVAVGEGVTGFNVGDRVGAPWLHWTCGECEFCLMGRETLCSKQQVTG